MAPQPLSGLKNLTVPCAMTAGSRVGENAHRAADLRGQSARPLGVAAWLFDVRGAGFWRWFLSLLVPPCGPTLRQYLVGASGGNLAVSSGCRLAGTLAGRAGSGLAGGAGRVLAWRVNGAAARGLRNADPAGRQLPSARPGSWCVLPHRPCNRNRAWCFLAVSDRRPAGRRG
jgi:hypothetical protein